MKSAFLPLTGLLGLFLAFCGLVSPVHAATPGVVDNAHILQADTVSKVSAAFGELKQKYSKDILIETFPAIPADMKEAYKPEQKALFFAAWAKSRESAENVNGVYVLICMDPTRLEVGVGNETQKHAFTLADRDKLRETLIAGFKDKKYDETLRGLPGFFAQTFATNHKALKSQPVERGSAAAPLPSSSTSSDSLTPPAAPQSSGPSFGGILVVLLFIVGGVMIFGFIARMLSGGGSPGYAGGGGGGGFFSSLLGGIGGAIAGNYIYDSFFRGDSHNSGSSDVNAAGQDNSTSSWGNDSSTDSSFSNDGGGFDSGGGSDFGGGDSGGGGGDF